MGEPPGAAGPWAPPPGQAGPQRPWEPRAQPGWHAGCREEAEGGSGPPGVTPSSGRFFCSTEEVLAQHLGTKPPFADVQDPGQVEGPPGREAWLPTLLRGLFRLRASATHGAQTQGGARLGAWGSRALAMPDHRTAPQRLTCRGPTASFRPWGPPAGCWSPPSIENVLKSEHALKIKIAFTRRVLPYF